MPNQYYTSRFFKNTQRKPKPFNYKPRVYDEDKDDLEKRKRIIEKRIERQKNGDRDDYVPSGNISFRSATKSGKIDVQKNKRSAMLRLLIILIALIVGFKYLMDWIDTSSIFDF